MFKPMVTLSVRVKFKGQMGSYCIQVILAPQCLHFNDNLKEIFVYSLVEVIHKTHRI